MKGFYKIQKAEMSSKMIVTLILLIIGFGIILLVYAQLNWKSQTDKEICHESVVLRATLPQTGGVQNTFPLKCKTSKICVRGNKLFGGGECEELKNYEEVNYADVDDLTEVEKLISQEIVDCWSVMGEGKLPLFSQFIAGTYGFGDVYPTCVICSRIAFDEKTLKEKNINVAERDVLKYMRTHKIPNGEVSYYDYLTQNSPAGVSISEKINISLLNNDEEGSNESVEINLKDFVENSDEEEEIAILFMQISAPSGSEVFLNSMSTLAAGAGLYTAVGGVPALKFAGRGLVTACGGPIRGTICAAVAAIGVGYQQWSAYDNRDIAATACGDVFLEDEARNGCSVVRTVNYNLEEISQYCGVIESIA